MAQHPTGTTCTVTVNLLLTLLKSLFLKNVKYSLEPLLVTHGSLHTELKSQNLTQPTLLFLLGTFTFVLQRFHLVDHSCLSNSEEDFDLMTGY